MSEIISYIYSRIIELSDLDLQKKLWLNENNDTGLTSSYVEVMCSLFDDFNFEDFIKKTAKEAGFSTLTINELESLRELLNNYNEKDSDEEIINDPKWKKIVEQAKIVVKVWNNG